METLLQSSTARALVFFLYDSVDHVTGKTGLSPTVVISKNGGSFASPSGAVSEIGNGFYKVAGNATDSNTLGTLALSATSAGADQGTMAYNVVAYAQDDAVRLGLTALPNAAAEAAGGLYTRGTGAGQINQPANGMADANVVRNAGTAITAAAGIQEVKVASLASAAIQSIWDAATSALSTAGSIGKRLVDFVTTLVYAAAPTAAANAAATRDVNNTSPAANSLGAAVNSAASAGDPWATALPGAYGAGTAGYIVGTNLDIPVGDVPTAAENALALLKSDFTGITGEPTYSPLNAMRSTRNDWSNTATPGQREVYKEDGTTVAFSQNLGVDPTAQPIVSAS